MITQLITQNILTIGYLPLLKKGVFEGNSPQEEGRREM